MSAIKAIIQHQAALAQIDEMHRRAATRTRLHIPASTSRGQTSRRTLMTRVETLRLALRGESV